MAITIEQLLATLSIDKADTAVVADRIVIIQRDPQPNEDKISVTTDIRFLIVDLDSDPLSQPPGPNFTIYINETIVGIYGGGVFVPTDPWSGEVLLTTTEDPFVGWHVTVQQPPTPVFESEQIVDVRVEFNLASGYGHKDWGHFDYGHISSSTATSFEYSFTIEDITPPRLLSAEALDLFTTRITFDDNMAVSGAGSVLELSKWEGAIIRLNKDPEPGVTLNVVAITEVEDSDGKQFDLTFQWEMTQWCLYQINANSRLEDSSGNQIEPGYSVAQFTGYNLPIVRDRNFSHWSMMIPLKNRQEDETRDLERFSNCIQESLALLLNGIDRFTERYDPDTATDEDILEMLSDMGNPFDIESLELTSNDLKKLLRFLIRIYKLKGTNKGIEGTVYFLLGEQVEVVEYAVEGWVLGEDELGNGSIAEVVCETGEPYDFSTQRILKLKTNGYIDEDGNAIEQEITFNQSDFSIPSAGIAAEVTTVINSQIQGGSSYVLAIGTPAEYSMLAPFNLAGGEDVTVEINGVTKNFKFHVDDFETTGAATAEEVANRFLTALSGDIFAKVDGFDLTISTVHTGLDAEIKFISGTALAPLGITPGDTENGTDANRISCYSTTIGVDSWIQITGGTANEVLNFDTDSFGGTGGAILAPEDAYTLYSFDIETENELDQATIEFIRGIADYMKPAHTHLINVRKAPQFEWPDGWILGISELDVGTELIGN